MLRGRRAFSVCSVLSLRHVPNVVSLSANLWLSFHFCVSFFLFHLLCPCCECCLIHTHPHTQHLSSLQVSLKLSKNKPHSRRSSTSRLPAFKTIDLHHHLLPPPTSLLRFLQLHLQPAKQPQFLHPLLLPLPSPFPPTTTRHLRFVCVFENVCVRNTHWGVFLLFMIMCEEAAALLGWFPPPSFFFPS